MCYKKFTKIIRNITEDINIIQKKWNNEYWFVSLHLFGQRSTIRRMNCNTINQVWVFKTGTEDSN